MYYRVYPSKNNTIFRYKTSSTATSSENINCGANPVMELMDGRGESKLMFEFNLPDWLKTRLATYTFKSNLILWDAGTLFSPGAKLKDVSLKSFEDSFVEGDGYSFLKPDNLIGYSNWRNRDSTHLWSATAFTTVATYHLNTINEDLSFSVTDSIQTFLDKSIIPKYSLEYTTPALDNLVYSKYIHSNYTKTIFKPYIEFFIDDEIKDKTFECTAGSDNKVYLINQTGLNFTGALTAKIQYADVPTYFPIAVSYERQSIYSISVNPPMPGLKQTYANVIWMIDDVDVKKQLITIKNPNQFEETVDYKNLFFYPTTPYTHNIVRQGDVVPFTIVSQIRGKGDVVKSTYEYRITSADGFEMVPWMPASVYREKIYFNVNTEYFFPEQQYEVWLRNKTIDFAITSNQTHKFKLAMNDKSHMRQLSTSPYYSREIFFGK